MLLNSIFWLFVVLEYLDSNEHRDNAIMDLGVDVEEEFDRKKTLNEPQTTKNI